jgi:hypothetical protein
MIANARDIPLSNLEREILAELRSAALRLTAEADGVALAAVLERPRSTRRPGVGSRVLAAGVAIAVAGGALACYPTLGDPQSRTFHS